MFQSYIDFNNNCIISSEEHEATVNCFCQEINVEEVKQLLYKDETWFQRLIRKFKRGLKICVK